MALPKLHTVKDYETAVAFLGSKQHRPAGNNTRIFRYTEEDGERIGVMLHSTEVVTYLPDGTFLLRTGGWTTPTTRTRMYAFSPVRFGAGWSISHDSDPKTPVKVQKCRTCHGTGNGTAYRTCRTCGQGAWAMVHDVGKPYASWSFVASLPPKHEGDYEVTVPKCYRCNGEGRVDYGSKPIPTGWGGAGPVHIDADGKVIELPEVATSGSFHLTSKPSKLSKGYYAAPMSAPEPSIQDKMLAAVPALTEYVLCPAGDDRTQRLSGMVIHLNDRHQWTREAIADWMESTDLDLSFVGGESS